MEIYSLEYKYIFLIFVKYKYYSMKKIIALAGSNSKNSINKQLAVYAANQVNGVEVIVLDLNNFELPLYGIDYEMENGIPENAQKFLDEIKSSDAIVLSLAEHNGAYSSVFKNLIDWMSRIDGKLWNNKPMLLMATSPGDRGGASVLEIAKVRFPHMGGNILADFSLPFFTKNFSENGIVDIDLKAKFNDAVSVFKKAI